MKKIIAALVLVASAFLSTSSSAVASPEQEKAFVDAYKKAFETSDAAKLESFLYTKNADPEALEFYKMMLTAEMGSKVAKIELRNLTPEEVKKAAEIMPSPSGGQAKLPVTPVKKLVIGVEAKGESGSSTSTSESFVALVDGKFLIPVPVAVK